MIAVVCRAIWNTSEAVVALYDERHLVKGILEAAAPAIRAQATAAERSDLRDAMEDVLDECARCPETNWEGSLWDRLNPGEDFDAAIKEAAAPAPDLDVVLVPGKDVMRFLEWHRKSREGRGTSVARADRDALDRLHAALDRTEKGTR